MFANESDCGADRRERTRPRRHRSRSTASRAVTRSTSKTSAATRRRTAPAHDPRRRRETASSSSAPRAAVRRRTASPRPARQFGDGLPTPSPTRASSCASRSCRTAPIRRSASTSRSTRSSSGATTAASSSIKSRRSPPKRCNRSPANDRLWVGIRSRTSGSTQLPGEVHFRRTAERSGARRSDGFDQTPGGGPRSRRSRSTPRSRRAIASRSLFGLHRDRSAVSHAPYLSHGEWRRRVARIGGRGSRATGNVPDLPVLSLAFRQPHAAVDAVAAFDARRAALDREREHVAARRCEPARTSRASPFERRSFDQSDDDPHRTYGRSAFELAPIGHREARRPRQSRFPVDGRRPSRTSNCRSQRRRCDAVSDRTSRSTSGDSDSKLAREPQRAFDLAAGEARPIESCSRRARPEGAATTSTCCPGVVNATLVPPATALPLRVAFASELRVARVRVHAGRHDTRARREDRERRLHAGLDRQHPRYRPAEARRSRSRMCRRCRFRCSREKPPT